MSRIRTRLCAGCAAKLGKTYSVAAVVQELARMYKEAQNEEAAT